MVVATAVVVDTMIVEAVVVDTEEDMTIAEEEAVVDTEAVRAFCFVGFC